MHFQLQTFLPLFQRRRVLRVEVAVLFGQKSECRVLRVRRRGLERYGETLEEKKLNIYAENTTLGVPTAYSFQYSMFNFESQTRWEELFDASCEMCNELHITW